MSKSVESDVPRRLTRVAADVALLAAVYAVVARLGLMLDAVNRFATLVWPPSGIALVALLRIDRRLWPGIALGAFAVNVWTGAPAHVAMGIALGNTLEAFIGAHLLRRYVGFDASLYRLRDVFGLLVCAAMLSTLASATVGVTSLWLGHVIPSARFGETWRAWWLGDLIGVLVVAPPLLTWSVDRSIRTTGRRYAEAFMLVVALAATSLQVFGTVPRDGSNLPYTLFPLLIWAALRFGPRGAASASFAVAATAVAATTLGKGPFVRHSLHEGLASLQAFVAIAALTVLVLGAVVAERERVAEENARLLRTSRDAVAARDEFLSVASHELRTPLTALLLQLGNLHDRVAGVGNGIPERLDKAVKQTRRLSKLIDDLLDVSRITTGRLSLEHERLDLAQLVREVAERFADEAAHASCTLTIETHGEVEGNWDRLRLEQVVTNVLANAIKYGPKKPVELKVAGDADSVELTVRDHGIGIAAEDAERIFERFGRAVSPRHYGGMGLGLYISRQIVLAHGGSIAFESQVGEGTTFRIRLPRRSVSTDHQA